MVRSSVVSAVSSACEIRLVPDWRCFWSTNSKRSSSRKAPGSLATPWVAQLVLSTQKAEPQDACAVTAAAKSATPPEHAIANRLFIPFPPEISSRVLVRSDPGKRNKRTASAVRYRTVGIRRKKAGRAEARRDRAPPEAAARRKTPGPARRRVPGRGGRAQRPKSRGRARH